jgi:hypothetical protein
MHGILNGRGRESMMEIVSRLAIEPPFRILARAVLKHLPVSVKTRALWELSARPAYLLGVVTAAEQARQQNISEISVLEFGVARGEGLLALTYAMSLVLAKRSTELPAVHIPQL